MKAINRAIFTALFTALLAGPAAAHDGRRFDVQVIDDKLVAQGYISGSNPTDDGNGVVRDYYNAIHGHWESIGNTLSRSTLPGFDVDQEGDLSGDELWLTVTGVKKWSDAPFDDYATGGHHHGVAPQHSGAHHGGPVHPDFMPVPADEWVQVGFNGNPLTTDTPLLIDPSVGQAGHYDLTFDYQAGSPLAAALAPDTALYVVELRLSTSDPSILPSDTIYAILSPPGASVAGSHGLSLATEAALGTPVPEPAAMGLGVLLPVLLRRGRRA